MVALHGRDLFRENVPNRMLCCEIRKSRPLARGLAGLAAFFTGLRRAQAKSRASIEVFDRSGASVKISPLADWTTEDVIRYTHEQGLPEHPLYAAGYTSIGCDPCTRPVVAGEDERAGRWWWECRKPSRSAVCTSAPMDAPNARSMCCCAKFSRTAGSTSGRA